MSLSTLLEIWRTEPTITPNITAWRTIPARSAQTVPLPADLHPDIAQLLQNQGIQLLYTHQAEVWDCVQAGRNPVIATGTASGKTLAYNLPVLNQLVSQPQSRFLYLFPTKALAYDQLKILDKQLANTGLAAATYDGDTPANMRPTIRAQARIILTNPDMLHTAILPHHTRWADFFRELRFVVIDEMHIYRGVFGSHVANVIRRLKRVAQFYGNKPQFILTSATVANPIQLAGQLTGEETILIDRDGSAKGPQHFLIYNPPVIKPDLGLRRSLLQESIRLTRELLHNDVQTIVFGRTRRTVELLLTYLREQFPQETASSTIRAYRSGYLPRQRREIERDIRRGQVRAVTTTSALELGIDIGGLDAAILAGYPGTIAATWQQAGRAGRQQEPALAVLVASASPLDQFLAHHPHYFFERSPEQARINPDNLLILLQHLRCAAFELPFQTEEPFGEVDPGELVEYLEFLESNGELFRSGTRYFWMADKYPAEHVSLRSASPNKIRLLAAMLADTPATANPVEDQTWTTIGEVDSVSGPWMVHPQAIYLHEGESYFVETLDLEQGVAYLRSARVDYYTEPKQSTTVALVEEYDRAAVTGGDIRHGEVLVTTQVTGYNIVQWFSHERLGEGSVDLPPRELNTTAYWLALAPDTIETLREEGMWTNDPNDYGPNWAKQRNAARRRDGYRCQICGTPEQDRQHHVHHKLPFRRFSGYEQANQLSNLITLCPACHRRAETTVQMRSGLGGLGTVLGHLAPLFLMCDSHDLGIHTDPQSPLVKGQPAIIIYEMIPAGIGFSKQLFELHQELVEHAQKLVHDCPCTEGCPSCVGPAGEGGRGGKAETLALLERLITLPQVVY